MCYNTRMARHLYGHRTPEIGKGDFASGWIRGVRHLASKSARGSFWHRHDETSVVCCLRGEFTYELHGIPSVTLSAGHFLVIPAHVEHRHLKAVDPVGDRLEILLATNVQRAHDHSAFTRESCKSLHAEILKRALSPVKCDKRLTEIDERDMQINARINVQTGVLLNDLNRYGKIIDRKYLDYLLVSAEGEDVFQLLNTATLLKQVQYAIRKQMEDGGGNAAQVEHYVGLYLVILKGWEQAHQVGLENIEKKFLPKLAEIQKDAEQNTRDTRELLKTHADEASHLEANLRISQNTIEVSKAYHEILVHKQQDLKESLDRLKGKIAVAQNTYRTVKTASGLLKLINDSSQEYEAILNFDPPLLDTIYADQMLDAFKEVSAQLKK